MSGATRRQHWKPWDGRDPALIKQIEGLTDRVVAARELRKTIMSETENQQPQQNIVVAAAAPASPTSTPLPPAPTITSAVPSPARKPVPSGGFAASLKAIVDEALAGAEKAKADGLSKVRTAVGKIGEATAATVRVTDNMASNIEDQAASILSELGQISNDL